MANDPLKDGEQLLRRRKALSVLTIIIIAILVLGLGWLIGRPLMEALRNKESFRAWIQAQGFLKYFIMAGLMILQIIIAVIPGGPIEVAAGYAFGTWMGTLVCVAGSLLGTALVFWLTRRFGMKLVQVFVSQDKIDSFAFLHSEKRLNATIFILFLVPGVPKDILTYLAGLMPIRMWTFVWLSNLARLPSIFLSAMGGHSLGERNFRLTMLIVAAGLLLAGLLTWLYRRHLNGRPAAGLPGDAKDKADV